VLPSWAPNYREWWCDGPFEVEEELSLGEWMLRWRGVLPCQERTGTFRMSDIDDNGKDIARFFKVVVVEENWPRDFWGTP